MGTQGVYRHFDAKGRLYLGHVLRQPEDVYPLLYHADVETTTKSLHSKHQNTGVDSLVPSD